jgi:hypothetical protein
MKMSATSILKELKSLGADSYKRVLLNHGANEPVFGVKIEELKKFQKRIRKDYQLALDLYDTGNYDAQYLAGLIADEAKMTKKDLRRWVTRPNCVALRFNRALRRGGECTWVGPGDGMDRRGQRKRRSHRLGNTWQVGCSERRRGSGPEQVEGTNQARPADDP